MTNKQKKLNKYWQDRQREQERLKIKDSLAIEKEVKRMYNSVLQDVEKDIEAFYARYASKEGLTREEARKKVSLHDVKQFEDKAARYVKEKNFSEKANQELRLYNLKMRVNRAELLRSQIGLEVVSLGNDEEQRLRNWKSEGFIKAYEEQAGILGQTVPTSKELKRMAKIFIDTPYHGANFSERIWERNKYIRGWLDQNMHKEILRGKNPRDVIPDLRRRFDVTAYEAERLAITEYTFIQGEAQKASYKDNGVEWWDLSPESDACDICVDIASAGPYRTEDFQVGENFAPHPNCRCGTFPNTDKDRELLEEVFERLDL